MYSIAIQVQGRIKLHKGIHKEEVFMFLDNHRDRLYDTLLQIRVAEVYCDKALVV